MFLFHTSHFHTAQICAGLWGIANHVLIKNGAGKRPHENDSIWWNKSYINKSINKHLLPLSANCTHHALLYWTRALEVQTSSHLMNPFSFPLSTLCHFTVSSHSQSIPPPLSLLSSPSPSLPSSLCTFLHSFLPLSLSLSLTLFLSLPSAPLLSLTRLPLSSSLSLSSSILWGGNYSSISLCSEGLSVQITEMYEWAGEVGAMIDLH